MASASQKRMERSSDAALMPPPPKRIKRPLKSLNEDQYTDALSTIIARDFFPGLAESQAQQEYLEALGGNEDWLNLAGKRLEEVMSMMRKRRKRGRGTSIASTPRGDYTPAHNTPRGSAGVADTPASVVSSMTTSTKNEGEEDDAEDQVDTSLSLDGFLSKYTSEDNASFSKLVKKQNRKKEEKYAWLREGNNKILAPRQILHREREQKLLESNPTQRMIEPPDDRPAVSSARISTDQANTLMFMPSTDFAEDLTTTESRAPPKAISHNNTRLPAPKTPKPDEPPTPSLSAVDAAISDRRHSNLASTTASEADDGSATPRVNGYAFVSDSPSPPGSSEPESQQSYDHLLPKGDSTPNPFKLQSQSGRESLLHRIVDRTNRANRSKREASRTPSTSAKSTPLTPYQRQSLLASQRAGSTPKMASDGTPIPRFGFDKSSGAGEASGLTPAGRKLWEKMGSTPWLDASQEGRTLKDTPKNRKANET